MPSQGNGCQWYIYQGDFELCDSPSHSGSIPKGPNCCPNRFIAFLWHSSQKSGVSSSWVPARLASPPGEKIGPSPRRLSHGATHLPTANRPFDLLVSSFWSILGGPKSLSVFPWLFEQLRPLGQLHWVSPTQGLEAKKTRVVPGDSNTRFEAVFNCLVRRYLDSQGKESLPENSMFPFTSWTCSGLYL